VNTNHGEAKSAFVCSVITAARTINKRNDTQRRTRNNSLVGIMRVFGRVCVCVCAAVGWLFSQMPFFSSSSSSCCSDFTNQSNANGVRRNAHRKKGQKKKKRAQHERIRIYLLLSAAHTPAPPFDGAFSFASFFCVLACSRSSKTREKKGAAKRTRPTRTSQRRR
jgi:hypothetical protein